MRHLSILVLAVGFCVLCLQMRAPAAVLLNAGFEAPEAVEPFAPTTFGDWSGDGGSIVGAENGIQPAEGLNMLRFDFTGQGTAGAGFLINISW